MAKASILVVLLILLSALGIGIQAHKVQYKKDRNEQQYMLDLEQNRRIQELEKEVRILKTDLLIIQNGFGENEV